VHHVTTTMYYVIVAYINSMDGSSGFIQGSCCAMCHANFASRCMSLNSGGVDRSSCERRSVRNINLLRLLVWMTTQIL